MEAHADTPLTYREILTEGLKVAVVPGVALVRVVSGVASHMLDIDAWDAISGVLSTIDDSKRPNSTAEDDCFGSLHLLLFGELANLLSSISLPAKNLHSFQSLHG